MAYCAKCGVELDESEPRCPLCGYEPDSGLKSYNDEAQTPYPPRMPIKGQHVSRKSVIALISAVFLLPLSLTLICDLSINCAMTWSGYPVWALALVWLATILPIGLKKKRPVLCTAVAFAGAIGYLFFIEEKTGGSWMNNFALPLVALVFVLVAIPMLISKYIKFNGLTLASFIFIASGVFCVALELLLNNAFGLHDSLRWSLYPVISCTIVSFILAIINRNEALKDKLRRKFFI